MYKIIPLIIISLFLFTSCSSDSKKLDLKLFARVQLVKRASMDNKGSFNYLPQGIFSLSLMLQDSKGQYLKSPDQIVKVEILSPDGSHFKTLRHSTPFNLVSRTYLDGYLLYAKELKNYLLLMVDLTQDMKFLPPSGKYTFKVTGKDGNIYELPKSFFPKALPPIKDFPTKILYNPETRIVKWNPAPGASNYVVHVFEGEKKDNIDWEKLLYNSNWNNMEFSKTEFKLPDSISFQKGQTYHILVEAIDSLKPQDANYQFLQDLPEEIAQFTF